MSIVAVIPGFGTLWLGLPFVLAAGGIALGLSARAAGDGRGTAAAVIGSFVLVGGSVAYLFQAIEKVS